MTAGIRALFDRILKRRAQRLAVRIAPHLVPGEKLLDIGSGTGHNTEALRSRANVTCAEVDVVDYHVVGPRPVLFDGSRLPFGDRAFDTCLLVFVLSYPADVRGLLLEAARVAARRVIVVQSCPRGLIGRLALAVRGWFQGWAAFRVCALLGLIAASRPALRRRRLLSRGQVLGLAREAGLELSCTTSQPGMLGLVGRDLFVLDAPGPTGVPARREAARVSVIIPARNEVALIGSTVASVVLACDRYHQAVGRPGLTEIVVVDNASDDGTAGVLAAAADRHGVRVVSCEPKGAARARNLGAGVATGQVLVFLDADTRLPTDALVRFVDLVERQGYAAGITRLGPLDGGLRARCWWAFWNAVRHLPLPRAKAMPACMFCTRAVFDEFGPFDEHVALGEEWPILAGLYRARPDRFVYDQSLTALSSARRMDLQPFGYTRTYARYAWAVLHESGRVNYSDQIRHGRSVPAVGGGMGRNGVSAWLGRLAGRLRLNTIEPAQNVGTLPGLEKHRGMFGRLLVGPINLGLFAMRAGVRVLPRAEWLERERLLHRTLYGMEVEATARGGIVLPRWPGVVLSEFAGRGNVPAAKRLGGLTAASRALERLHALDIKGASGVFHRLSHGDATVSNVVFDPATGEAHWFDFDAAHDSRRAASWRHADDLRALLYSALVSFADVRVERVYLAVRDAYTDSAVWEQLHELAVRGAVHGSPFHFAQACPPVARRRDLEALLRRADAWDVARAAAAASS